MRDPTITRGKPRLLARKVEERTMPWEEIKSIKAPENILNVSFNPSLTLIIIVCFGSGSIVLENLSLFENNQNI